MNRIEQHNPRRPSLPFCVLAALALLLVAASPRAALAQWQQPAGSNHIHNTNPGNVGVGTSAPTSALEVHGPDAPITLSQAGVGAKVALQAALGRDLHLSANAKYSGGTWNRFDTGIVSWNFFLSNIADYAGIRRSAAGAGAITWTELFVIKSNGNVGIGTSNPSSPLTVTDDTNVTPLLVNGNNSNVIGLAIGNSNPGSKGWAFQVTGSGNGYGAANGSLVFRQASDNTNPLVITPSGNVGFGTAAPASKLHVVGDITVSGNINAKYQDVAEWVPATQKLAAGTVVVLDADRVNHVLASLKPYDTRVAGVVSAQPGISLGEAGEGKILVATTGRVKVKVDATRGPIKVGDLLVTSDREGVAMASVPVELGGVQIHRPGTVIGKALEPLSGGVGEILVLLSLQ